MWPSMHSNSKASHKIHEVIYRTWNAVKSQTFNALCNHGFDVFKSTLQVNAQVILEFQVIYNLKLWSRISSTISKLRPRMPITSHVQPMSNTNYCISNAFWSRGKNAVNEPRASTTRSICDQEPLFNEQYLKSNRGFLKYVESVKHE